jgi:hypothetical protein
VRALRVYSHAMRRTPEERARLRALVGAAADTNARVPFEASAHANAGRNAP